MKSPQRTIWVVRHGERADNIDESWKETAERWDDPPLSSRGHQQADEVGIRLSDEQIDHVFVSPFSRCIETLHGILGRLPNPPKICIESGLAESVCMCNDPPGIPSMKEIKIMTSHPIDSAYQPVMPVLRNEYGIDFECIPRIANVIRELLKRHPTGNVLIVSHGAPIAAIHLALIQSWHYVGQCTIGKIIDNGSDEYACEFYDSSEHLSDQSDLRGAPPERRHQLPRSYTFNLVEPLVEPTEPAEVVEPVPA